MPNPRQRKNNKNGGSGGKPNANGLRRLHTKMNKAPTMKGPLALQQGWDKKKTVRQKSVPDWLCSMPGRLVAVPIVRP